MAGALDGLTVVDFCTGAAGALATLLLSDHGARVVRVIDRDAEALRGGGFVVWDRGKECARIDFAGLAAQPRTSTTFDALIRGADVVLHDFAPSHALQLMMSHSRLRTLNPTLVVASITAYGMSGPWKDEPPIDDLVLARTGVLGGLPGFRPPPVHLVHPLPSVGAAALGALGIASALYARDGDGVGRTVHTSLMAGALLYHPKVTGERLDEHVFQTHPNGSAPFYSVYQCADGEWIQLGCVHAAFIRTACTVLAIEDVLTDPRFGLGLQAVTPEDDEELRGRLAKVIGAQPLAHWMGAFETADVPFAQARWTEQSLDDPQVAHNQMVVELDDPKLGPVRQMGVGLKLSDTPGAVRGPRQDDAGLNVLPDAWPVAPLPTASADTDSERETLPLEGTRILEITNLIAGPTTGRLLADLGADVVKFEPLTGDMSRPIGRTYFYSVNFNKRSVSVDARRDEGKAIVQAIARNSDALVANLRPHATERMGITPENNPRLIETHLTGYGWTGPYSRRPGIDPLAQAMMGLERAQGGPDNSPVFPAQLAPTDFTTGAIGALGTVLGLLVRKRSGTVQRAESNLLNGAILLTSEWFSEHAARAPRPLADRNQYGLNPFHRLYEVLDGWVYVAADSQSMREAFCSLVGAEPEDDAEGGHPNETVFAGTAAAALDGLSVDACLSALVERGIACAPAMGGDSEVFLNGDHAHAAGVVADTAHPTAGAMRVAWPYISIAGANDSAPRPTPLLGEHNREVLAEVGFDNTEVEAFYSNGVVKTEAPGP
jgi:crotonobetainyl-CoA:carnitine CoA-transferase CaiB-like acyl-CoA transferase